MKYKTTIEIVSEASDRHEAADIAGEYLSGNLVCGVGMKCRTSPVYSYKKTVVGIAVVLLVVAVGIISALQPRHSLTVIPNLSGQSAIQPPLKTAGDKKDQNFKKEWQKKQKKAAIDLIKSVR